MNSVRQAARAPASLSTSGVMRTTSSTEEQSLQSQVKMSHPQHDDITHVHIKTKSIMVSICCLCDTPLGSPEKLCPRAGLRLAHGDPAVLGINPH